MTDVSSQSGNIKGYSTSCRTVTLSLRNLNWVITTYQPLSQRLPKHSVDVIANVKLGIFGAVKAIAQSRCGRQGLVSAHDLGSGGATLTSDNRYSLTGLLSALMTFNKQKKNM